MGPKDYEYFLIVDHRRTANVKESQITSSMNIIGAAVHKAVELTSHATREVFHNPDEHEQMLVLRLDREATFNAFGREKPGRRNKAQITHVPRFRSWKFPGREDKRDDS